MHELCSKINNLIINFLEEKSKAIASYVGKDNSPWVDMQLGLSPADAPAPLPDERKEWCEHIRWTKRGASSAAPDYWGFYGASGCGCPQNICEKWAGCPICLKPRPKEKKAVRLYQILDCDDPNSYSPIYWKEKADIALQAFREVIELMPKYAKGFLDMKGEFIVKDDLLRRLDEMGE